MFLFAHVFDFFSLSIMSVFKESSFAFTIPFTYLEIMKAIALVEHLSTTGF